MLMFYENYFLDLDRDRPRTGDDDCVSVDRVRDCDRDCDRVVTVVGVSNQVVRAVLRLEAGAGAGAGVGATGFLR